MIGHYLLTLTPEQEDRVLTTAMHPGGYFKDDVGDFVGGGPCLVGTVCGENYPSVAHHRSRLAAVRFALGLLFTPTVESTFDALCGRFGVNRVTAAIRNRILANRARRTLTPVRETASV